VIDEPQLGTEGRQERKGDAGQNPLQHLALNLSCFATLASFCSSKFVSAPQRRELIPVLMSDFDRHKWNAKYTAGFAAEREPSQVLVGLEQFLPKQGRALEIASGAARNGIWLARRGLDVTVADISAVGLAVARERAAEAGVTLTTLESDLQDQPFPAGPWDLILSVCYLWRPLFARYPAVLAPGGLLVVIQPTKTNLTRHNKPPADFLLDDGELPRLVTGLEILHYAEGWQADDRHDAVIVARQLDPLVNSRELR
jgi:tellurite methyltransferase